MKQLKRIFFITLTLLTIGVLLIYVLLDKEIPRGQAGKEADTLAKKILKSIANEQFTTTEYIQWSFRDKHHYLWNRKKQSVIVSWESTRIQLDLSAPLTNSIIENPIKLNKKEETEIIQKALSYFNNDSFWVVAPHKLFDKATKRELIISTDNKKSLLVTYQSGGSTPGDSYLWHVDQNYRPTSYQMWVSIIPIGGLEASWENWKQTESGTYLPQKHVLLGMDIPITNLRAWND